RCFTDHQALMVDARLHPTDIVTHDEEDVWLLRRRLGLCGLRSNQLRADSEQHSQTNKLRLCLIVRIITVTSADVRCQTFEVWPPEFSRAFSIFIGVRIVELTREVTVSYWTVVQ